MRILESSFLKFTCSIARKLQEAGIARKLQEAGIACKLQEAGIAHKLQEAGFQYSHCLVPGLHSYATQWDHLLGKGAVS